MNLAITGRNMDVTPALREYTEEKLAKMEKYLSKITSAHVILAVEKYRHIAEVTLQAHGLTLKGLEETGDMYSSIDKVMDKIEIQARRIKEKISDKNKGTAAQAMEQAEPATEGGAAPYIYRGRTFNPKPMTVEEAALQFSLRGDDLFLAFHNSGSGRVNILYRRRDGNLALMETA